MPKTLEKVKEKQSTGVYYSKTIIRQKTNETWDGFAYDRYEDDDGQVWDKFVCHFDLEAKAPSPEKTKEDWDNEAIAHLTDVLDEQDFDNELEVNLFGFTSEEFAKELVFKEQECSEKYGTTWELNTNFEQAQTDPNGNWEHPGNL